MTDSPFGPFPIIRTNRLMLRRIMPADAPAWMAVLGDPQVIRYLSDLDAPMTDPAAIESFIAWADAVFADGTGLRWAITLKDEPTLIGTCGFHKLDRANRRAEIGYELSSHFWRQGIMAEALAATLDFCFDRLALHRVEADVTAGNEASAGILRRFGFTPEGTWREAVYSKGVFRDLWQFGLLEHEYRTSQPR